MKRPRYSETGWTVIWHTPDVNPDADNLGDHPLYIHDHAALLEQCQQSLDSRVKSYPAMIANRKIDRDDAEADITAWQQLVAEWTWICTGTGAPPPSYTIADRIMAVDLSLQRISQRFDQGAQGHDLYRQAHLVQALRWHLQFTDLGTPVVHHTARLTRAARADLAAQTTPQTERKAA